MSSKSRRNREGRSIHRRRLLEPRFDIVGDLLGVPISTGDAAMPTCCATRARPDPIRIGAVMLSIALRRVVLDVATCWSRS